MYDLVREKETRLTKNQRAYNPVFMEKDSSIAFLSTYDGGQNIYRLNLKENSIQKLTDYEDHSILSSLTYDFDRDRLIFNRTQHHFRDTYYLSTADSSIGVILSNPLWDARDAVYHNNKLLYSDDRSGIFNLFMIDENSKEQAYVTNVTGGAFMADMDDNGAIVYSLYQNGKYNIAIIDSLTMIDEDVVGYSPKYFMRNDGLSSVMKEQLNTESKQYTDEFTTMFILPRLMLDYETVKPGFYFYSSEVIERLNVFGGASVNKVMDVDLFFIFEFRRFYPTLFAEVFYLTRNIQQSNFYSSYELDDNLKFRLTQFDAGMRFPLFGMTQIELKSTWQVYRAFVKENIPQEHLMAGVAYDYYKGWINGFKWSLDNVKRLVDSDINPSKGYAFTFSAMYEKNDFIKGLNLSDAGTLTAEFSDNNTWRVNLDGHYYFSIPNTQRWTISLGSQMGWLSNNDVDSFFNYFGGGLIGIKGYPFYSIEGTRQLINNVTFRIPLFMQKHIKIGWVIIQNSVLGIEYQNGNAWRDKFDASELKSSIGIQWRLNGFSFYNFPTAIELEMHRGLDIFKKEVNDKKFTYGNENRFYFKLLFGF